MHTPTFRALLAGLALMMAGTTAATAEEVAVAQVTPEQLTEIRARQDAPVLLLDVRTPEEYAAGHIPGAVNIPYDQVGTRLSEIPKSDEVVLYCRSGRRAGLAAETLAAAGYTRLAHLTGDMQGWSEAGLPVEMADAANPPEPAKPAVPAVPPEPAAGTPPPPTPH
jgi:rhodanese-related sulfurtransferase